MLSGLCYNNNYRSYEFERVDGNTGRVRGGKGGEKNYVNILFMYEILKKFLKHTEEIVVFSLCSQSLLNFS